MLASRTVASPPQLKPIEAAIAVIGAVKKAHIKDVQAVHIIFSSLIQTNKKWCYVASVVIEPIRDNDIDDPIIFGHLPKKYEDLYEDLLPEVDNLNLIYDDSVWKNIKYYLLDVCFYQAVHFNNLNRISETGGGYFKETKYHEDNELDEDLTLDFRLHKKDAVSENSKMFSANCYKKNTSRGN